MCSLARCLFPCLPRGRNCSWNSCSILTVLKSGNGCKLSFTQSPAGIENPNLSPRKNAPPLISPWTRWQGGRSKAVSEQLKLGAMTTGGWRERQRRFRSSGQDHSSFPHNTYQTTRIPRNSHSNSRPRWTENSPPCLVIFSIAATKPNTTTMTRPSLMPSRLICLFRALV